MRLSRNMVVGLVVGAVLLGACGDDDDGGGGGDIAAYCDFGASLDEQDEFPTDEQLEEYRDLAPEEISDDVDLFIGRVLEDGEAVFEQEDEDSEFFAALERIEAFDEENCGIDDADTPEEPSDGE
jgi:hypothetical protein